MIALFKPASMRQIDAELINDHHIPGVELMENAAQGVTERVLKALKKERDTVFVLCGPGNNGGDGFAVLSLLAEAGVHAQGVILADPEKYSGDALYEYERAFRNNCLFITAEDYYLNVNDHSVVVDAIFGTGLSRRVSEAICGTIQRTNHSGAYIISVDIPSGLNGENGAIMGMAFQANETVTFQNYKIGLLTDNGRMNSGEVFLHPISGEKTHVEPDAFLICKSDIEGLLPPRPLNSHKGKNGRALILGGCSKYKGAVKLCAAAALRAGCGLLTVGTPGKVVPALYDLPEAMCAALEDSDGWSASCCNQAKELIAGKTAMAIGPGMGEVSGNDLFVSAISSGIPTVIDADGLNYISAHRELISILNKKIVLTPHPVELSRLLGCEPDDILSDMPGSTVQAAKELNAVVVLKGATSYVSDGEKLYLNITGNPGLAKGGSGDTLTGLILAFMSQGLEPVEAACAGTYLLGASADCALSLLGSRFLMARDVIDMVQETCRSFI